MGAARDTVERAVHLYNSGAVDDHADVLADDASLMSPAGPVQGRAAIVESARGEHAVFSDLTITACRWVEDGDIVVLEYTATGQHTGPTPAPDGSSMLPPTGQAVRFDGLAMYQVRDGKIVHERRYYDMLPLALQLGMVVPAGTTS